MEELILSPWWVAATLAVITYFGAPILGAALSGSNRAFGPMVETLRIVFTLVFAFASLVSLKRSLRTGRGLERQTGLESLKKLHWKEFENLLGEVFRRRGYSVGEQLGVAHCQKGSQCRKAILGLFDISSLSADCKYGPGRRLTLQSGVKSRQITHCKSYLLRCASAAVPHTLTLPAVGCFEWANPSSWRSVHGRLGQPSLFHRGAIGDEDIAATFLPSDF